MNARLRLSWQNNCRAGLLMILAVCLALGSFVPSTAAQAAPTLRDSNPNCLRYVTVPVSGSIENTVTKLGLSWKYGYSWKEIAKYNNIGSPYTVSAGQRLCIPFPNARFRPQLGYSIQAWANQSRVYVTTQGFKDVERYTVLARRAIESTTRWYELGTLKLDSEDKLTTSYNLPVALYKVSTIIVCLKNTHSNAMLCRTFTKPTS